MAEVKFIPNNAGFHELRSSGAIVGAVEAIAARWAAAAGPGYGWEGHQGATAPFGRWRATVWPDTPAAHRQNRRENTLIHVLGGG